MEEDITQIRFVTIKGNKYVRIDDIYTLLNNFAATEENDVQYRISELVSNLSVIENRT